MRDLLIILINKTKVVVRGRGILPQIDTYILEERTLKGKNTENLMIFSAPLNCMDNKLRNKN